MLKVLLTAKNTRQVSGGNNPPIIYYFLEFYIRDSNRFTPNGKIIQSHFELEVNKEEFDKYEVGQELELTLKGDK